MPPHCDTLDGPVVKAAKAALDKGDVTVVLPWAPKEAETEIKKAFAKAMAARKLGKESKEVADLWFFETVVRLHRAGEGAPYTGLKPAGLDTGPVVPRAERCIEKGDPKEVIDFLKQEAEEGLHHSFKEAMDRKKYDPKDVDAAREYVEAMLGFILYSHGMHKYIKSGGPHGGKEAGGHGEGHEHED